MADQTFIEFLIDLTRDHYQKPKSERKSMREEREQVILSPYSHKWFGMIPSTIKQLSDQYRKKN